MIYAPEGEWCPDQGWTSQHDQRGNGGSTQGREEGAWEGTQGGDGRGEEEEAHVFLENTHRSDQEDHPNHHDYRDYGYGIHGNS